MLDKSQIPNGKAPGAGHTKGLSEGTKQATDTADFTPSSQLVSGEFAVLAARFAALGHTLHQAHDNKPDMVCSRWGLSRYLASADEAKAFLVLIGGKL